MRCLTSNCIAVRKYRALHKKEVRLLAQKWDANNPGYRSAQMLRLRYGMTTTDWANMFLHQGGKCAICKAWFDLGAKPNSPNAIHVDHQHGKNVRGLLCHNCNVGLGLLRDDVGVLISAKEYLEKNNG